MSQIAGPLPIPRASRATIAFNGWFWNQECTGSGQYLGQLLQALVDLSADFRFVVFVPACLVTSEEARRPDPDLVRVTRLRTPFDRWNRNLAKVWFEQVAVPRASQQSGADLLHIPYWATPARSAMPAVTTVHDVIPAVLPVYRKSIRVKAYTRFVSQTVRRSALVLADSLASAEDIRRVIGLPPEQLRVIYLGVDPQYRPVEQEEELRAVRERYRLPPRFVLYLGGFDQRKNVPRLIRAHNQMAGSATCPPLVIAGKLPSRDTTFFPDPRKLVREHRLETRVQFIGEVAETDKPALYSLAACLVFPSLYEGFGLPVLEAMSCGTPVITSRTSSLGELAADGGILIDPLSESDIAQAMGQLVHDAATREQYVSRALARASLFSWANAARLTVGAYHDVLIQRGDRESPSQLRSETRA